MKADLWNHFSFHNIVIFSQTLDSEDCWKQWLMSQFDLHVHEGLINMDTYILFFCLFVSWVVYSFVEETCVNQWRCSSCTDSPTHPHLTGVQGWVYGTHRAHFGLHTCPYKSVKLEYLSKIHTATVSPQIHGLAACSSVNINKQFLNAVQNSASA